MILSITRQAIRLVLFTCLFITILIPTLCVPTENYQHLQWTGVRGLFSFMTGSSETPTPTISPSPMSTPIETPISSPTPSLVPEAEVESSAIPVSDTETEVETTSPSPLASESITPSPEITPIVTSEEEPATTAESEELRSRPMDEASVVETTVSPISPLLTGEEGITPRTDPSTVSVAAGATSGFSMIALIGIAIAILAPAVLIYWGIRRRNAGFENMPAVGTETNLYRGQNTRGTFSVGDE